MDSRNVYKELRKAKGLTQSDFAKEFSLDQSTVSKWESGHAVPDHVTLKKLADFYSVTVDYLLGRTDNSQASFIDESYNGEIAFLLKGALDLKKNNPDIYEFFMKTATNLFNLKDHDRQAE